MSGELTLFVFLCLDCSEWNSDFSVRWKSHCFSTTHCCSSSSSSCPLTPFYFYFLFCLEPICVRGLISSVLNNKPRPLSNNIITAFVKDELTSTYHDVIVLPTAPQWLLFVHRHILDACANFLQLWRLNTGVILSLQSWIQFVFEHMARGHVSRLSLH